MALLPQVFFFKKTSLFFPWCICNSQRYFKWTLFAQEKTFFIWTDLPHMRQNIQGQHLRLQCRYNDNSHSTPNAYGKVYFPVLRELIKKVLNFMKPVNLTWPCHQKLKLKIILAITSQS